MNPVRPSMISGLRPRRSDCRAHIGDENAHSSAESEKIAATIGSGMPICRPIAGSTDCIPVLPRAVTTDTQKRTANERLRTWSAVSGGRFLYWVQASVRAFMAGAT